MTTTHIVVFKKVLSKAEVRRIERAIKAIDSDAYVVSGWTRPNWQPGHVSIDESDVPADTRQQLYRAACNALP